MSSIALVHHFQFLNLIPRSKDEEKNTGLKMLLTPLPYSSCCGYPLTHITTVSLVKEGCTCFFTFKISLGLLSHRFVHSEFQILVGIQT